MALQNTVQDWYWLLDNYLTNNKLPQSLKSNIMNTFSSHSRLLTQCLLLLLFLQVGGCKEYFSAPEPGGFSDAIIKIIPRQTIDSLRALGFPVYEGFDPPAIEGIYLMSPNVLTRRYSEQDGLTIGYIFSDYKYRFSNQNDSKNEISLDYKSVPTATEEGQGLGGFLSGTDSLFTLFVEEKGVASNIPNRKVSIYSGIKTAGGIKNLEIAFVVLEKTGDDSNTVLIPVGTGRMIKDGDGLSEEISTWRMQQNLNKPTTTMLGNTH